jgi:phosphopantothenoylcysteine decarboxylase/phosphopantothenate--cysteine ligase
MPNQPLIRLKRVVLCAGGGYQVYSLPAFVLALLKHICDEVQVVLSPTAAKMTSRYALQVATRREVFVEFDDVGEGVFVPHIELAQSADVVLVYPATVNIIGKVANGIADELITALVIAAECPVFFVPLTNDAMWRHPAVQRNVARLKEDGYAVLPPLPSIEIATREGLAETTDPFPLPSLAMQIAAAMRGDSPSARARRESA